MSRLSGAFHLKSNRFLVAIKLFGVLAIVGAIIGGSGIIMNLGAKAETVENVAEHEIQVDTVNPAGNTVGNGDNVLYQIYGNTNFADATNVLVTITVANAVFDVIPDICKTVSTEEYPVDPVSNISEDRTTLTCNAGAWIAGSSFRIDVTARALGPNNGKVTMDASLASDNGAEVTASGTPKTIVASFTSDVGVSGGDYAFYNSLNMVNTQWYIKNSGMVIPVYWHVAVDRGSERPGSASFTANITLSNPTHADQAGFSGVVPFSGGACQAVNTTTYALPHVDTWNTGIWSAFSSGGTANSNMDSGACTLTGSGANYTLTVTGMDTSLRHAPTRSARDSVNHYPNYGALPANELQYASGVMMLWVPWTWFAPGDVARASSFTASISGYNPVSISGQANSGEDTENNSTTYTIMPTGGWSGRWYPYSAPWGGTHSFLPGDDIGSHVGMSITAYDTDLTTNRILCSVRGDNYTFKSMSSIFYYNGNTTANDPRVTMQYTTAAAPAERLNTTCADSVGGWTTYSPNSPPSAAVAAAITRVRAVWSPGGQMTGVDLFPVWKINDSAALGTQLWNFNMVSVDGGVTWPDPTYMITSPNSTDCVTMTAGKQYRCTNSYHDYAYVIGAKVSVVKDTANSKATYAVGEAVDYKITVSTAQKADSLTKSVVTDTLPKGLTYIPDSANIEPDSVTTNGAGVTTIIWSLNGIAFNEKKDITYQARVTTETGVTSVTNTAVAALYNEAGVTVLDTREDALRRASDTINITSSGYVEIFKNSEKQEITAEDELAFIVTMQNHDANPHQYTDVIDVLPYNGDGRTPETNYHGTLDKMSVESNQKDVVFYYSTADPSTISVNPHDPSNGTAVYSVEGNTVGWSRNKPASGVTAVRAIGGEWTPEDGDIVLRIAFERDGWWHGDVFSNSVGTVARSTILKMLSSDAVVTVEDESLIPVVPDTGYEENQRNRNRNKTILGVKDDSMAVSMGLLWAGTFVALSGIIGVTVFVLKSGRLG